MSLVKAWFLPAALQYIIPDFDIHFLGGCGLWEEFEVALNVALQLLHPPLSASPTITRELISDMDKGPENKRRYKSPNS